jgi:hypothetical protein
VKPAGRIHDMRESNWRPIRGHVVGRCVVDGANCQFAEQLQRRAAETVSACYHFRRGSKIGSPRSSRLMPGSGPCSMVRDGVTSTTVACGAAT